MSAAVLDPVRKASPPGRRICHIGPGRPICGAEPNTDGQLPHEILKCLMAGHIICAECERIHRHRG